MDNVFPDSFFVLAGQHAIRDSTDLVCDRKKKKKQRRIGMLNGSGNKNGWRTRRYRFNLNLSYEQVARKMFCFRFFSI